MSAPLRSDRAPALRVATLLPAATEIVCAIGAQEALVGVSHECDFPPGVGARPALTRTRLGPPSCSAEIDRDVRRTLEQALSVYEVDVEALARARPDVIVTQDLCDVCAVSVALVEQAAARALANPELAIVSLHPSRLDEVFEDVVRVARALGREEEGRRVAAALRARVAAIGARSGATKPEPDVAIGSVSRAARTSSATRVHPAAPTRRRPHVLTIEWIDPVMVGGLWMPELIELAGGVPLRTRAGEHAPTLSSAELAALDPAPDLVLVKPCGYPLEKTRAELATLRALFDELDWPACRTGEIWIADGSAFFNRPGPRIVESLEILAACVDPHTFADFAQRHAESFERLSRG
jgi:iron complex transport system substrate-binding protein